jgi:hypothetical protein
MSAILSPSRLFFVLLALAGVVCLLVMAAPQIQQAVGPISFDQAPITSISSVTTALQGYYQVVPDVQLGIHAALRHGEIASEAREQVWNCDPKNLMEFKGIDKFDGYKLFACLMSTGKVAVWVIYTAAGPCREVTAFLSKGVSYLRSLVEEGRYLPVQ